MIKIPTTLVLGAGASIPYGFPSGEKLVELIIQKSLDILQLSEESKTEPIYETILQKFEYAKIKDFAESLFFSSKYSIDSFLEHRVEFIDIGKFMIAFVLLDYEKKTDLFASERNWYKYLFSKLNSSFDDFDKNNISFLTFNYDRSLEYFLHTSLKHSFGRSDEECWTKLSQINIIHLHGRLGALPYETNNHSIPYDFDDKTFELVLEASKNIKIIHEQSPNTDDFKKAYELIITSKRLYFLGFGYHIDNLNRLNLRHIKNYNKHFAGTCFGMGKTEREEIGHYFLSFLKLDYFIYDNLDLLKEEALFD